jgi:hypothetical protein
MAWRAYPNAGSGTANSSLAPRVSTPFYKIAQFAPNIPIQGLHQGVSGARPVIFNGRTRYFNPGIASINKI